MSLTYVNYDARPGDLIRLPGPEPRNLRVQDTFPHTVRVEDKDGNSCYVSYAKLRSENAYYVAMVQIMDHPRSFAL